jgi:hypothetical protein
LTLRFEKVLPPSPDKVLEIADDFLLTVLIRTRESKEKNDSTEDMARYSASSVLDLDTVSSFLLFQEINDEPRKTQ